MALRSGRSNQRRTMPWRREDRENPVTGLAVGAFMGEAVWQSQPRDFANPGRNCQNPEPVTQASHEKSSMNDRDRKPPFGRRPGKPFAKGGASGRKPAWTQRDRDPDGPAILYGWHTVSLALANPRRQIRKLLLTENAARRLADEDIDTRIAPEIVRPGQIDQLLSPDAVHQGLLAEVDRLPSPDLETLVPEGIVMVLDQITDPHNVGAIMRSAAAFAVKAIVTTARHSPEATGVLAKSASGALELVPLVSVQNLARALAQLNERGFMTVGLDSEGSDNLTAIALRAPLALVLGAEGKGLRQLTRETCSVVARLDMPGEIKSLNVSNAAVLALYIGASRLGLMG
jgi:23S rRNA (guanosine2251-2'-O)-methyltransferase